MEVFNAHSNTFPPLRGCSMTNPPGTAYQRALQAADDAGLPWKEEAEGKRFRITPDGHKNPQDHSTVIYNFGDHVGIKCYGHDDEVDVWENQLGLTQRDKWDNPAGTSYKYRDGRLVTRTPDKEIRQWFHDLTTGKRLKSGEYSPADYKALFGADTLTPTGPVFAVEGEKDAVTARTYYGVNAVSKAGGAQAPEKADWSPLAGRDVVIVADNDDKGMTYANDLYRLLTGGKIRSPRSVKVVTAAEGKDLTDHATNGHGLDELVDVDPPKGAKPTGPRVALRSFADVELKVPEYVWRPTFNGEPTGVIARRTLSLLVGRPGVGKSTHARKLAAELTRGELPGTFHGQAHMVAYIGMEESLEFAVAPSLRAAGADMSKVVYPELEITTPDGEETVIARITHRDIDLLAAELARQNVRMVVVDPLMSLMPQGVDLYRSNDVREGLQPWVDLAETIDGVVLGVSHLRKSTNSDVLAGINGSSAFGEVARSAIGYAKRRTKEGFDHVMSVEKNSLGPEGAAWTYDLDLVPVPDSNGGVLGEFVAFSQTGDSEETVGDVLSDMSSPEEDSERDEAENVIVDYLAGFGGRAPTADVKKFVQAQGLTWSTVNKPRFKKRAGIVSTSTGYGKDKVWYWEIKANPDDRTADDEAALDSALDSYIPTFSEQESKESKEEEGESKGLEEGLDERPAVHELFQVVEDKSE